MNVPVVESLFIQSHNTQSLFPVAKSHTKFILEKFGSSLPVHLRRVVQAHSLACCFATPQFQNRIRVSRSNCHKSEAVFQTKHLNLVLLTEILHSGCQFHRISIVDALSPP